MSKTSLWGEGVVVVSEQNLILGGGGWWWSASKTSFWQGGWWRSVSKSSSQLNRILLGDGGYKES